MFTLMGSAYADIMFTPGSGSGSFLNVVSFSGSGTMTVTGGINDSSCGGVPCTITFASTQTLSASGNEVGGSSLHNMMITVSSPAGDFGFHEIAFTAEIPGSQTVDISATSSDGRIFQSTVNLSSNNALLITATNGELIRSVNLVSSGGFSGVSNVRFRGGAGSFEPLPPSQVIPEPGTLGLLGSGLIALSGLVRRKLWT